MKFKDWYWRRWIRQHGCKVSTGISKFGKRARLALEAEVRIGDVAVSAATLDVSIGAHTYIRSGGSLQVVESIGRYCSIGSAVVIGQEKYAHPTDWLSSHPFQFTGTQWQYEPPSTPARIGHDVWIGEGAMIMEGVEVGTGAIVATRALVTRDVPPYAVVAGFPAKVVRYRYPEAMIERLLASRWWERDTRQLLELPLHDPAACLDRISGLGEASYTRVEISRRGCKVLASA